MRELSFTDTEIIPFSCLFILVTVILIVNYTKDYREILSPLSVAAVVLGYYCLLGPYEALKSGDTMDRLRDMRPFYASSFYGALIFLIAFGSGFVLNNQSGRVLSLSNSKYMDGILFKYGKRIVILGFVFFTISVGGRLLSLINPLDSQGAAQVGGSISNYLNLCINFLIPGLTILFLYYVRTKKGLLWFLVPFILCIGVYTTLGFRYRLVLLLGSIYFSYYLIQRKKPNVVLMAFGIFLFISFMGIINLTRQYGSGLKLDKLDNSKNKSFYSSGLEEAQIFQTSGAVIDLVPDRYPYAGFQPLISTILFPIPRAAFENKNSAEYLFNILDFIYGKKISEGAAILCYAEYYLAFGWLGIIVGAFILGWFYKKLWNWFKVNSRIPLVIAAYSVTVIYLYVIISRGYLPQVTMLFFFSVFPIYLIIRLARRNYKAQPLK